MRKIHYRSGYKYQLAEAYFVSVVIRPEENIETDFIGLDRDGLLAMKEGYAWDGPSGPTVDTKSFMRGSLVHDALYQLMRREDGMTRLRAWYVLLGVRKGAGFAASPKAKKEIRTAP